MINSFLCASAIMIVCYVIDILLVLAAIGLFVWYYIKTSKANKPVTRVDENAEKINDDTYVIQKTETVTPVEPEPVKSDNAVEHFVNQISAVNEEANTELNENAIVVKHEVEQPVKKVPKKDEIQNYVMIGGVKKEKTSEEKVATQNRGSHAFQDSADFLNRLKEENSSHKVENFEKDAAKTKAAKTSTTKKQTTK